MHESVLEDVLQPGRRLPDDFARLGNRQRPHVFDERRQIAPLDEFHHQEMRSGDFAGVLCGDDVRMMQLPCGPHLALEPRQRLLRCHAARRQDFQRHEPIQPRMPRFVDRAHPAGAEFRQQFILAEHRRLRFNASFRRRSFCSRRRRRRFHDLPRFAQRFAEFGFSGVRIRHRRPANIGGDRVQLREKRTERGIADLARRFSRLLQPEQQVVFREGLVHDAKLRDQTSRFFKGKPMNAKGTTSPYRGSVDESQQRHIGGITRTKRRRIAPATSPTPPIPSIARLSGSGTAVSGRSS